MTRQEATKFVHNVLRKLWDKWQPSDFQTDIWVALLCRYDYEQSDAALRRWYAYTEKHAMKPFPGQVRKILVPVGGAPGENKEPCRIYGLARANRPDVVTWFSTGTGHLPDWDRVADIAERARKRFEDIYGGEWVTIQSGGAIEDKWPHLRGEAALRNAEALIIAGPDSAAGRFLIRVKGLDKTTLLPDMKLVEAQGVKQ